MAETPVVCLRARTVEDQDVLYRLSADLETWEERSPAPPGPLTRARYDARTTDGESGAAFVIDVDGTAVGVANLVHIDDFARHAEVGIALVAEARARGIGTAALRQLVEFAFVRRNVRRLHLEALASNAAAVRAYEKAGFAVEGRLREHAWVRGGYEDVVLMGLLRESWRQADAAARKMIATAAAPGSTTSTRCSLET